MPIKTSDFQSSVITLNIPIHKKTSIKLNHARSVELPEFRSQNSIYDELFFKGLAAIGLICLLILVFVLAN